VRALPSCANWSVRPVGRSAFWLICRDPKLRIGGFTDGPVNLIDGQSFRLDLDPAPGNEQRAGMPHPEIFAVLTAGSQLLLDDGRLRLVVERCGPTFADTRVAAGGKLSANKGVNVPDVVLPLTALTNKDRRDLDVALELGADWVALSFVQRPEDVSEARAIIGNRAAIMSKARETCRGRPTRGHRGGVRCRDGGTRRLRRGKCRPRRVPAIQKRIIRTCRQQGKPVVVATQMLESMVESPVPTRAEASDVATAIYDGADAVMLSAESASGKYPLQAVSMMSRIIEQVEADPTYRQVINASYTPAPPGQTGIADAVCGAVRCAVSTLHAAAIVCYTRSGQTSLHAARERPECPVLSLSPIESTARRLAVVWGHPFGANRRRFQCERNDRGCLRGRTA